MYVQYAGLCGVDWVQLPQDKDRCRAALNKVWIFKFYEIWSIFSVAGTLFALQKGLCSIELVKLHVSYSLD
jgi:hypothetical protein